MQTAQIMTETLSQQEQALLNRWKKNRQFTLDAAVKDELQIRLGDSVRFDEPMSRHTYIKIGGKADAFVNPKTQDELLKALAIVQKHSVPCLFHGSGANTLVRDGGIRGIVISPYDALKQIRMLAETPEYVDVEVESGVPFSKLVHFSRDAGSLSLAPLTGIPGCVGGLVSMNAGTREREISDVLRSITVINRELVQESLSREKLEFEYRKLKLPRTYFIMSAVFRLEKNSDPAAVDLALKEYQKKRQESQPLNYPNLGSVFKNPAVLKGTPPVYAGQLVEDAGLKDVRVGGARISPKHANFIINEGSATARDVLALIELAKDRVRTITGVELETEIKIVGED